jgi:hypothetical protein
LGNQLPSIAQTLGQGWTMYRLVIAMALLGAVCSAALACYFVPRGLEAYHLFGVADDPAAIADRALAGKLDVEAVEAGIDDALKTNDPDLAQSFVALAADRHIALDPALTAKVEAAAHDAASARHAVESFAEGFVGGEPKDAASLAGTATGDLFVFGDIRDALREGSRLAMGQDADELVLGLATVGLAITAGTYASAGLAAPLRAGLTLVKGARKAGRLSAGLAQSAARLLREMVDLSALRRAASFSLSEPGAAMRAARETVKLERGGKILDLARDIGKIQTKAGTQTAVEALRIAETPRDLSRLAKLSEKEGSRTRAILKLLGRGAIMLGFAGFDLALWMLSAAFSLFGFVWSLKRGVEGMTERHLRRRKERRMRKFYALTAR